MKLLKAFIASVLVLSFTACQIPFGGSGSLKVQLPGGQSRAGVTTFGTGASSDAIRLQLTRNGTIIPLGGGDFLEKSIAAVGSTVSIDGLAPGPGYVLLVSAGHRAAGETFYTTDSFQKSDPFEITAGVDTSVSVALAASRIAVLEATAGSPHGATVVNGHLYYIQGSSVFTATGISHSSLTNLSPATVNGLSNDGSSVVVNTSQGIAVDNEGWTISMYDASEQTIHPNVLDSGTATIGGTQFAYYSGPGSTAGLRTSGSWSSLADLFSLNTSLQNALTGQVIRGFAASSNYLYLSTSIGAYRVDSDLLNSQAEGDISAVSTKLMNDSSFLIKASDPSLPIGPVSTFLAYINDLPVAYAFAGTAKGLFADSVDPSTGTPARSSGLPLVSGTQGLNITQVVTSDTLDNNVVYTAAYASNTRELLILNSLTLVQRISALEGLPSGKLRFTWYADNSSSTLYLVVTGDDATVKFAAGSLQVL